MYLQTKIPVKMNIGLTDEIETKVQLHIEQYVEYKNLIGMPNFTYRDQNNKEITNLSNKFISPEEANALYEVVKDSIPSGLSYVESIWYVRYLGAKLLMLQTLQTKNPKLTVEDIELVIVEDEPLIEEEIIEE